MKTLSLPVLLCLALYGQVFAAKVIPNNPTADLVLGQTDFVTGTDALIRSSFSLSRPEGIVIDPMTRKVFVADFGNARVLRYRDFTSLTNGTGAEAVFGKASFNESNSTASATNMAGPVGIHFDRKGRLWVADYSGNRVLMFEAASFRGDSPTADKVLGQPNFTTDTSGSTAAKFDIPYGVWVDANDRLWVADTGNNRVLRFDSVSTKANGASADAVLGQPNLATATPGTTSSKMNHPDSISMSSGGSLFVADSSNNRVLRFDNAASLSNGASASAILGQVDFTSSSSGVSATTMNDPSGVLITLDDTLWVTDRSNERLLRFDNASTKPNSSAANGVVGQPNLVTNTGAVTANGSIDSFSQAFVDAGGNLWIADTEHYRVLRFPPDVTRPLLTLTGTVPKTVNKKKVTIKGTASDTYGISKVQYRIGTGALKTAIGTTSWQFTAPLKMGKNKITIFATDSVGNVSLNKVVRVRRS